MSGAPIGTVFSFDGKDYAIEPTVLSRGSIEALSRCYAKLVRRRLAELRQEKAEYDAETYQELTEAYKAAMMTPGIQEAVKALMTPEGLVVALHHNCQEIPTIEEAQRLVDAMPNLMDLFGTMAATMQEDLAAAKNSFLPAEKKDSPTP